MEIVQARASVVLSISRAKTHIITRSTFTHTALQLSGVQHRMYQLNMEMCVSSVLGRYVQYALIVKTAFCHSRYPREHAAHEHVHTNDVTIRHQHGAPMLSRAHV